MLNLVLWPDPILSKRAEIVTEFGADLQSLTDQMIATMKANDGIGLAAPQVGISKRIFVMEGQEPFINPEVVSFLPSADGVLRVKEGCLSFPGVTIEVSRHYRIRVGYQDIHRRERERELVGIDSICFQHELDHLNGKTFLDYASLFKRRVIEKRMKGQK